MLYCHIISHILIPNLRGRIALVCTFAGISLNCVVSDLFTLFLKSWLLAAHHEDYVSFVEVLNTVIFINASKFIHLNFTIYVLILLLYGLTKRGILFSENCNISQSKKSYNIYGLSEQPISQIYPKCLIPKYPLFSHWYSTTSRQKSPKSNS